MRFDTKHLSPDLAGEVLRSYAFTDEGFGLYINNNVNSSWQEVKSGPVLLDLLDKYDNFLPEDWTEYNYGIKYFFYWINASDKIEMIFWTDGDATLIFNDCGRVLVNSDAKKSHGWKEESIDKG